MIELINTTPTADTLKAIYDVCNEIFKEKELFYTSDEVKDLKQNKENIFIK
jgi:hypothetical protein